MLLNLIGIFLGKEKISLFLNNNLLTALEIMIIMAATEDYHLMPLNILNIQEGLKAKLPIHIQRRLTHAPTDHNLKLLIANMEASISLKVMKFNLLKDSTMLVLLLFHSK